MPDSTSNNPSAPRGDDAIRKPPPRVLVEAAQRDYHRMRGRLSETTSAVRSQLDNGFSDFDATADVWRSLREQQDRPATMLLAAIAIVQLAKVSDPRPLGEPDNSP